MDTCHSLTVADVADLYVEAASAGEHKEGGKPKAISTMYNERRAIKRSVKPHLGDLRLYEVSNEQMQEVIDWTSKTVSAKEGKVALDAIRNVWAFATWKGFVARQPSGLTAAAYEPVKTLLTDADFRWAWEDVRHEASFGATPTQISAHALLLMFSTLQPATAIVNMRLDQIDTDAKLWRKPMGGQVVDIPLSDRSMSYIDRMLQSGVFTCGRTAWVFPTIHHGSNGEKPIDAKTPSRMMSRTRPVGRSQAITPQDLLDTAEDWLTQRWVHPTIIKCMTGRVGDCLNPELLARTVAAWDQRLGELVGCPQADR